MKYKDIQKLKEEEKLISNGINYAKVMAIRLYPESYVYTVKMVFLAIFYDVKLEYEDNNSNILISHVFNIEKRKDYYYIINKLKKIIKKSNTLTLKRKINLLKVLNNTFLVFKLIFKNKRLDVNFFDLLRISALEFYFKKVFRELNILKFNEALYISFSDSNLEENLFAQYFVNKKIKTATLQHGQYRYIKKGFEVADVEGYMNFVSDYIFTWGEKTRIEWAKAGIDNRRVLKLGALKEFTSQNIKTNYILNNKTFVIVLGGESYNKSNINMIHIANKISKKYNYKYYLRLHPMNDLSSYSKYTNTNYLGILGSQKIDFSILHMTGVFVEMLSKGSIFFVFEDDSTEEIFKFNLITFNNIESFSNKYDFLTKNKEFFLNKMKETYSEFNCASDDEELSKNYSNAINKILLDEVSI